jgi:tRNA pseudouridine55 synthase
VNIEAIRHALDTFRGEIDQIPPAFSAIKRDGQKLYDLARAGKLDESELAPRRVTIYKAHPTHFFDDARRPRAMIHIECSSGTYIRSLVRDLGRALNCGATMTFLVRTQSGHYSLQNAMTLEEIAGNPHGALLPMEATLNNCGFPIVTDEKAAHDLSQGRHGPLVADYDSPKVIFVNQNRSIAALSVAGETFFKAEKVLFLDS